jgi:hypothetical protein|tara:strand:+ start:150 stop:515 length:366 start_codon:yes stop_codon:yes gene_type:complete
VVPPLEANEVAYVIVLPSSTLTSVVRLPTVAVVFPVMAALLVVQLTVSSVQPNVTVKDELVVAAREMRDDIESRYRPGDTERMGKLVALIEAPCVDAETVAIICGPALTRSTTESSQYRIA